MISDILSLPIPEPRIAAFEKLGYGMFIHWGIYSMSGNGEKTIHFHNISKDEYKKRLASFTAADFDPRAIARFAKRCGMNYIVLTTRHHDGFSLYDTRGLSDFDALHSACGRDLIFEFAEGCRAEGIVPFFYHTTLDWWQDSFETDFPAYLDYLYRSVEILCTHYGKIGGFWFDGNWAKKDVDWQEEKLYTMIREKQPDAIIINNSGIGRRGESTNPLLDSVTFENGKPGKIDRRGKEKYQAAEMCQTMNTVWGWGERNFDYKSPAEFIETLCLCRRYGANYLLNVSPDGTGNIPLIQQAILDNTGKWIRLCAPEVIYQGVPTDAEGIGSDFALEYDGALYFFVHKLSAGGDTHIVIDGAQYGVRGFSGVEKKIRTVRWTDNDESLSFRQEGSRFELYCSPYSYSQNLVVRVARAEYE